MSCPDNSIKMCLVIVVSLKQLFKMYKALTFIAMNDNSGCLYCGILVPKEQTKEESSLISSNPLMSVWYCPPRHLCPIWSPLVSPDSLHTRWPTSLEKSNPQIAKVVTCVCVCINSFKGATTNLDDFEDKVLHKDKEFKTSLFCF